MSSLFDDSFLADLQAPRAHGEEPPPPPEDEHVPEPIPDDLFGGKFDTPPGGWGAQAGEAGSGGGYYRNGAPAPSWTRRPCWTA